MTTLIKKKDQELVYNISASLDFLFPLICIFPIPLCFTFLSPSHGCFFCCSLEACPGFRSEILAQTGEWAILPSSMAPPQSRWHTLPPSPFSHSCSPWQVHKSVFHLKTPPLESQTCRKPDCNPCTFSLAISHKCICREETWTKFEWKH